ncbi:MAG TPA: ABC transporter substrate-binding protein [Candidatus Binatia bacterium]
MIRLISCVVTALFLTLPVMAHAQSMPLLNLGFSGSGVGADLLKVTERADLWHKHGLDVRPIYLTSGTLMAQTLSAGDIGLAGFDVTAMLNLGVSGATDIKVISVMINRLEPFFVVRKNINSAADLKGKAVAISRYGSGSDIITRVILRYWKLDPDRDVRILQSGNTPSRMAALIGGHMDAAIVSSTQVKKIIASGCCRVFADLAELPLDYANYGVVVDGSLLKTQRANVRRFLEALTEGIFVYKTKPEIAKAVLRQSLDENDVGPVYERLAKSMNRYPLPERQGIQSALDALLTPKARGARAENFMDTSLMEEIKKSGFIDRLYAKGS